MLGGQFRRIMPRALHSGPLPLHLLPILLVSYTYLLPRELTVYVVDAALFPSRLALILVMPFAVARLAQSPVRPSLIDAFAGFASVWFIVSLVVSTSFEVGLVSGTSYAIDYGFAYLLGRASIRSAEDLRLLFRFFLPGILALVALLAIESISHRVLFRPIFAGILGQPSPEFRPEIRYGLMRALGPFPHPILAGVFLAGVLPFAWYLTHNARTRLFACAAAFGAIFTVSSTAVLGLLLVVGLIAIDIAQRITRAPIFAIAGGYMALTAVAISFGTQSGLLRFIIRNLTLDSQTAYYRLMIWEYGGAEAINNPVFGIGLRDWVRPEDMYSGSVDSYWLVISMLNGFPAMIALALVMVGTIIAVLRTQRFRHPADADAAKAVILFVAVAIMSGFTVHLWEAINSWIAMILGCGVSLATQARIAPAPQWQNVDTVPAQAGSGFLHSPAGFAEPGELR